MKRKSLKRILSWVMAVALLAANISPAAFTVKAYAGVLYDGEIDDGAIGVGEEKQLSFNNWNDYHVLWFTPETTGDYQIVVSSEDDVWHYLEIYREESDGNDEWEECLSYDSGMSFLAYNASFEAGKEYKLKVSADYYDSTTAKVTVNNLVEKAQGALEIGEEQTLTIDSTDIYTYTFIPEERVNYHLLLTFKGIGAYRIFNDEGYEIHSNSVTNVNIDESGIKGSEMEWVLDGYYFNENDQEEYTIKLNGKPGTQIDMVMKPETEVKGTAAIDEVKPLHDRSQTDVYTFTAPEDNWYTFSVEKTGSGEGGEDGNDGNDVYVDKNISLSFEKDGQDQTYYSPSEQFIPAGTVCTVSVQIYVNQPREDMGFVIRKAAVSEGALTTGTAKTFAADAARDHFVTFTPSENGTYELTSTSDDEVNAYFSAYLYEEGSEDYYKASVSYGDNYHSSNNGDFLMTQELEAGKKYILKVKASKRNYNNEVSGNVSVKAVKLNITDKGNIGLNEEVELEFTQDNQKINLNMNTGSSKRYYIFMDSSADAAYSFNSDGYVYDSGSISGRAYKTVYGDYGLSFNAEKGTKIKLKIKEYTERAVGEFHVDERMGGPDASEKLTYTFVVPEDNIYVFKKVLPREMRYDSYEGQDVEVTAYEYDFSMSIKAGDKNFYPSDNGSFLKKDTVCTITMTSSAPAGDQAYLVIKSLTQFMGEINVGDVKTASIEEEGRGDSFAFTAPATGKYIFYSLGNEDVKGSVYDEDANLKYDEYGNGKFSDRYTGFYIVMACEEGKTYFLRTDFVDRYYDDDGDERTGTYEVGIAAFAQVDDGVIKTDETKRISLKDAGIGVRHIVKFTAPKTGRYYTYYDGINSNGESFEDNGKTPYYYASYYSYTSNPSIWSAYSSTFNSSDYYDEGEEIIFAFEGPAQCDVDLTIVPVEEIDMGTATEGAVLKTGTNAKTVKYTFTPAQSGFYKIEEFFYDEEETGSHNFNIDMTYGEEDSTNYVSTYSNFFLKKGTVYTITVSSNERDTDKKEYFKINAVSESAGTLTEGTKLKVSIASSDVRKVAEFVPQKDGNYTFYTDGIYTTVLQIYNSDGDLIYDATESERDLEREEKNARINCYLTGGNTYLVMAGLYNAKYFADNGAFYLNAATLNFEESAAWEPDVKKSITFADTNTVVRFALNDSFTDEEMNYVVTVDTDGPVHFNMNGLSTDGPTSFMVGGHEIFGLSVPSEDLAGLRFELQAKTGTKADLMITRVKNVNKGALKVGDDVEVGTADINNVYTFVPTATGLYEFNQGYNDPDVVPEEGSYDSEKGYPLEYQISSDGTVYGKPTFMFMTAGKEYTVVISGSTTAEGRTNGGFITLGDEATALVLNQQVPATITKEGQIKTFTFTPAESGEYQFTSFGSNDTYGYLFNEDGSMVRDDDGGKGSNFLISCSLEAGKTYYFGAKFYGSFTGSFDVAITDGSDIGVVEENEINRTIAVDEEITLDFAQGNEVYNLSCTIPEDGQYYLIFTSDKNSSIIYKTSPTYTRQYSNTTGVAGRWTFAKDFAFTATIASTQGCKATFTLKKVFERDRGEIKAGDEVDISDRAVDDSFTFKAPAAGYYQLADYGSFTEEPEPGYTLTHNYQMGIYRKIVEVREDGFVSTTLDPIDVSGNILYLEKDEELHFLAVCDSATFSKAVLVTSLGQGQTLTLDGTVPATIGMGETKIFAYEPSEDDNYLFYSVTENGNYIYNYDIFAADGQYVSRSYPMYTYKSSKQGDFAIAAKLKKGTKYIIKVNVPKYSYSDSSSSSSSSSSSGFEKEEVVTVPAQLKVGVQKYAVTDIDDGTVTKNTTKTVKFTKEFEHRTLKFRVAADKKYYVFLKGTGSFDGILDFAKRDQEYVGTQGVNYYEKDLLSGREFYIELYGAVGSTVEVLVSDKPNHTHKFADEVIPGTCYYPGYTRHTCTECNYSYESDYTEKGAHNFVLSKVEEEAGCDHPGKALYYCDVCSEFEEREIPALGHDHSIRTVEVKATLTTAGRGTSKCSRCDDTEGFTIASPSKITLSATSFTADGKAKTPAVTVTDIEGKTIDPSNYDVTYTNNVKEGTAKATVTFKGTDYEGSFSANFTIKDNTKITGTFKSGAKYTLNLTTGLMSITGNGAMDDYQYSSRTPWFKYRDKIKKVSIGSGITRIGTNTFYGCTNLTEVTGCANVDSIGINTFRNCPILTKVAGCTKTTLVEQYAFCGSNKFSTIGSVDGTVNLPKGTKIGGYTFYECKGIKKLVTTSAMTYIGTRSFSNCIGMTTVTVGSACKTIGSYAFCGNTSLTTVNGCAGVTGIGDFAFYGNTKLVSVAGCTKTANIGKSVFRNCENLVKVGATANQINFAAAKAIGEYAFSGCKKAKYMSFGANVTIIGQYAFQNDSAMTALYLRSAKITSVGVNALKAVKATTYVPKAKVTSYKNGVLKGKGQAASWSIRGI